MFYFNPIHFASEMTKWLPSESGNVEGPVSLAAATFLWASCHLYSISCAVHAWAGGGNSEVHVNCLAASCLRLSYCPACRRSHKVTSMGGWESSKACFLSEGAAICTNIKCHAQDVSTQHGRVGTMKCMQPTAIDLHSLQCTVYRVHCI